MTTEQDILQQRLATAKYEQETAERARAYLTEIARLQLEASGIRLLQAQREEPPLDTFSSLGMGSSVNRDD